MKATVKTSVNVFWAWFDACGCGLGEYNAKPADNPGVTWIGPYPTRDAAKCALIDTLAERAARAAGMIFRATRL